MVADFDRKENREFFNKKFWYKTAGIAFIFVLILLAVADYKIYQKKKELSLQITAYQNQIDDIKKSNQVLQEEIANADNKDYLEKLGYEQLNQARPGETEYMFIESQGDVDQPQSIQKQTGFKDWFLNVWSWIKSKF